MSFAAIKPALWQIPVLLAITAVGAFLTYQYHPKRPALYIFEVVGGQHDISIEELNARGASGILWVDARPRDAYEKGHVPDALLINGGDVPVADALASYEETIRDSIGQTMVVYGENAEAVATELRERGFWSEVFVLAGGYASWKAAKE